MKSKLCCGVVLFLCISLLIGCGLSPDNYIKDVPKKKTESNKKKEPVYELTQQQIAMLYNSSLPKELLKSSNGQYVTVMLPKFHSGNYTTDLSPIKTDFHYTIVPPGTYHNEDGKQEKDYVACTFDYVTCESSSDYDTNVIRTNLISGILSEEDYPAQSYKSYDDYVKAYNDSVEDLFKPTTEEITSLELTGEVNPIRGIKLTDMINAGEEYYNLPFVTYSFKLSNEDYLYLRIHVISATSDELFNIKALQDNYLLRDKGMSNSMKTKLIDYLTSIDYDFDEKAEEIMSCVILGDYSSYYTISGSSVSMNSVNNDTDDSISANTTEEFNTTFTMEEQYKHLRGNNTTSSSIITGVEDVEDTGGYYDYDATVDGGYYED